MSYAITGYALAYVIYSGISSASESNKQKKEQKSASMDAERLAKSQKTAEQTRLSEEEAGRSASRKMFKEGLYFTSPGGTLGSGSRGSSRLMGQ